MKLTDHDKAALEAFDEIGYGNQAIIVGTRRRELKSFLLDQLHKRDEIWRERIEWLRTMEFGATAGIEDDGSSWSGEYKTVVKIGAIDALLSEDEGGGEEGK